MQLDWPLRSWILTSMSKNIEDPLPGFMIRIKYKRSLVKRFKKTMSFRQTELLSSTDKKRVRNKGGRNLNITENSHKLKDKNTC